MTTVCIFREKGKKQTYLTFLHGVSGFAMLEHTNNPVSFPISGTSLHGMDLTESENKALPFAALSC